jgi:hypothetical protein
LKTASYAQHHKLKEIRLTFIVCRISFYTIHEKLKAHLKDWALNAEGWHLNKRLFSKLIDKNI